MKTITRHVSRCKVDINPPRARHQERLLASSILYTVHFGPLLTLDVQHMTKPFFFPFFSSPSYTSVAVVENSKCVDPLQLGCCCLICGATN